MATRPIEAATGTPFRWRVLWAAFFSYLVDSYDLVVLAIAMPVLLKVLHVPLGTGGLLFSGTMVGAIFGSILFGLIAENYGRRFALILSLLWLGVAMGLILFISSWWHLLLVRLLAGLAIGGLWGPCSALIAEHWNQESRGRASSFVYSSFAVGAMLASLAGRLVLNVDWRMLFLFGSASIILALIVGLLIPARRDGQAGSLKRAGRKVGIGSIFARPLLRTTILATLVSLFNLAGYWGAASWLPTFLVRERGLSLGTMADFSLFMYVGMFAGFQIFGVLADTIGRRRSMMAAFFLVSFSLAVYIVSHNPLFLFWWGTIVGIGVSGMAAVAGAYYAEIFPEHLRAYAGSFCWNMGRIGAVLAPWLVGYVGETRGLQTGLAIICAVNLFGIVVLFFMPETLGKRP